MSRPARVILIEDSEDDARLVLRELDRGGIEVTTHRIVDTPEALVSALDDGPWDLIISDHGLPRFSAPHALSLVRRRQLDLPFIIVSGSMGEDLAVSAMKNGASDYIVKGRLARLVPAVQRELDDVEQRRRRAEAEQALRRTEEQLRHAQKMEAIGQLAGGVAHDFNNLLTAIMGYCELILLDMPKDATGRSDIEQIKKAGDRAATLTRQLLAFSRQQVLEPRVVNLNDVVADVSKLLSRVIGADIEFITEPDLAIGPVRVDPGQMEQVLMNLVVNARDAMPEGGRLNIVTRHVVFTEPRPVQGTTMDPGQYVLLTITDTGIGMPPGTAKRVFEPFFTTKSPERGTGLGLSTVYGIVKQSGGYIWVDSEPGRGTAFEIYLPCVDSPLDARRETRRTPSVAGTETVLFVDDDPAIRDLLRRALANHGYHVLTAVDGVDALTVLDRHTGDLDLLVTDLVMPRMGGGELAARLTAARPNLAVLYLSGYTNRQEWNREASHVRRAYLQKPFTPTVLMGKVRELLDTADSGSRDLIGIPALPSRQ